MVGDDSVPDDERINRLVDEALGYTSQILIRRDFKEAAAAMLKIVRHELEHDYDFNRETTKVWLEYEPEDEQLFRQYGDSISSVFLEVVQRKSFDLDWIEFREVLPEIGYGWRGQLVEVLRGQRRTNQARVVRERGSRWVEDGLYFTNPGELLVYRRLKSIQEEKFPRERGFAIFPLARGRIHGHTREPDFLIVHRGRTGILEIDGPHHNGRRSHDTSSEHLYRDAGISFVDRVSVEALNDEAELEQVLQRFFRRLQEAR
jgi:hypothetical protein